MLSCVQANRSGRRRSWLFHRLFAAKLRCLNQGCSPGSLQVGASPVLSAPVAAPWLAWAVHPAHSMRGIMHA